MDFLQEKFQITLPPTSDDNEGWTTQESARKTGEPGFMHRNNSTSAEIVSVKFNQVGPGMDISNQMRARINPMPLSIAGQTDVTDNVKPKSMLGGFTRLDMKGTDDMYTGEHVDLFYGCAYGQDDEGNTYEGFVERNNNLDRL